MATESFGEQALPLQPKQGEHDRKNRQNAETPENNTAAPISAQMVDEIVSARLREKIATFRQYGFNLHESSVLNILFDLMQEYQADEYLTPLPCLLLKHCCQIASEYYSRENDNSFCLRSTSMHSDQWIPPKADTQLGTVVIDNRVCLPVRGRFSGNSHDLYGREILGLLVLYPEQPLSPHEMLFYEKFSNRLGFAMHNHAVARRNQEHIEFVRNLVKDIGHNVLGPNMYFKLLLNQLSAGLVELGDSFQACSERGPYRPGQPDPLVDTLKSRHNALLDLVNEIQQNFGHSSLFLESLLRESHFTQGRYVLRTSRLNLAERVIKSQYNGYLPMFKSKGIDTRLEILGGCDTEDPDCCPLCIVEADFGLISQVPANIFSNALKYAAPTAGSPTPFMHCKVYPNKHWRPGKDGAADQPGLCVEVLTSGEPIPPAEAKRLFEKYFRASNVGNISGTGKGLHFVNEIVLQHKGEAGYRSDPDGNIFYFILPCAPKETAE